MGHFCSGLDGKKLAPTQMLYIAMADRNPRFVFQMRRWGRRWWPCLGHNTTLGWISIKLLDLARQVLVSCVSEGVIVFYLLCLIYAQRKLISTVLGYGIIMLKKIREEDVSLWSINKFRCTIFKFRHTNKYLPFV